MTTGTERETVTVPINELGDWCGIPTLRPGWTLDAAKELFTWAMKEMIGNEWPDVFARMQARSKVTRVMKGIDVDWAMDNIDFWASVIQKHASAAAIEQTGEVTEKQQAAIENMAGGLRKWVRD